MKRSIAALKGREHDVLVVGAGIYGVAAALDAAQRGLSVALIDAEDLASGVSWNSLKTIHGGLRYLQKADLGRMRESIRERRTLLGIAPEIVTPLRFVVPTEGYALRSRGAMALAFLVNDLVSADRNRGLDSLHEIPRARTISRAEVMALVPGLSTSGLTGGALWTDAQARSTERLVVGFARAAAEAGASLANHVEARTLLRSLNGVAGVEALDRETGESFEIRARLTLNCAGPGMASLLDAAHIPHPPTPFLRATNLVFRTPPRSPVGVGCRIEDRFLFLVPWKGQTLVGTEYVPAERPTGEEEPGFVERALRAFPWAGLRPEDLTLVHRGLVPGQGSGRGLSTRPLLLDHQATAGIAGLVSVLGVKYTTGRLVAERAIDLCMRRLGRASEACRTATTRLTHARILDGPLADRVRVAVRDEMARSLEDAVLRRLDLGTGGPPARGDLQTILEVMAVELGWTEERQRAERRALATRYEGASPHSS